MSKSNLSTSSKHSVSNNHKMYKGPSKAAIKANAKAKAKLAANGGLNAWQRKQLKNKK